MKPRVAAVVLNWKRPEDSLECLESCLGSDYSRLEVIFIDNHSGDDSVKRVRERFPKVIVLEMPSNLGYAGANNHGITHALERGADYVFVLNNDVVLEPDCVSRLVEAAETKIDAGLLAPKVLQYHRRQLVDSHGTTMNWFRLRPNAGEHGRPVLKAAEGVVARDVLLGAALLVSKETIARIGALSEEYFLVHEDADWCLRARRAGFKNYSVSNAIVYHKRSATLGHFPGSGHYYETRNFLHLAFRHGPPAARLAAIAGLAGLSLKHAAWGFSRSASKKKLSRAFFAGVTDYFRGAMGKTPRQFEEEKI